MDFTDRELKCVDCAAVFLFTAGEQEFYKRKGYQHDPKRCKQCRSTRVGRILPQGDLRTQTPKVETAVKCDLCGVETTVPFKPTGRRPVLCANCYMESREGKRQVAG